MSIADLWKEGRRHSYVARTWCLDLRAPVGMSVGDPVYFEREHGGTALRPTKGLVILIGVLACDRGEGRYVALVDDRACRHALAVDALPGGVAGDAEHGWICRSG